jgi:cytochrome c oxidase cbb3-type subunit 3
LAIAAFAAVFGLAEAVHHHLMITRLLKTEADAVRRDESLWRFANREASPLYGEYCADCHGVNMAGNRARGVPNLRDGDWLYGSGQVSDIEHIILYGIRSGNGKGWNLAVMPAYASATSSSRLAVSPLSPQDIRDTVEYLRTLEHKPAQADAAARGREIFAGRGACYDCHAPDGHGDTAIGAPNLTDDIWLYGDGSRESVFDSIALGHSGSCPARFRQLAAWQARALAVYVASESLPTRP